MPKLKYKNLLSLLSLLLFQCILICISGFIRWRRCLKFASTIYDYCERPYISVFFQGIALPQNLIITELAWSRFKTTLPLAIRKTATKCVMKRFVGGAPNFCSATSPTGWHSISSPQVQEVPERTAAKYTAVARCKRRLSRNHSGRRSWPAFCLIAWGISFDTCPLPAPRCA